MKHLKIIIGSLGIILLIAGAVANLVVYLRLKNQGIEYVFKYAKANPDKLKYAKRWGYLGSVGFWLMIGAAYMKD